MKSIPTPVTIVGPRVEDADGEQLCSNTRGGDSAWVDTGKARMADIALAVNCHDELMDLIRDSLLSADLKVCAMRYCGRCWNCRAAAILAKVDSGL